MPRIIAALIAVLLALAPFAANAATAQFICHTEEAANTIAKAGSEDSDAGQFAARTYVASGVCVLLPREIEVQITHKGKIFNGSEEKLQVVGFPILGSTNSIWYGIMPVEDDKPSVRKDAA